MSWRAKQCGQATRVLLSAAALLIGGAACSGSNDSSGGLPLTEPSKTVAEAPSESPTTNDVPSPSAPPYDFAHSATWSYDNDAGYSFDVTIEFGEPLTGPGLLPDSGEPAMAHPADTEFLLGVACSLDPELDAVIPATLTATPTTEGFPTVMEARYNIDAITVDAPGTRDDGRVSLEANYSDGQECEGLSSTNVLGQGGGVAWSEPADAGDAKVHEFFIILHDYFSPNAPDGDLDWLSTHQIQPEPGGDLTGSQEDIYRPDTREDTGISLTGDLVKFGA